MTGSAPPSMPIHASDAQVMSHACSRSRPPLIHTQKLAAPPASRRRMSPSIVAASEEEVRTLPSAVQSVALPRPNTRTLLAAPKTRGPLCVPGSSSTEPSRGQWFTAACTSSPGATFTSKAPETGSRTVPSTAALTAVLPSERPAIAAVGAAAGGRAGGAGTAWGVRSATSSCGAASKSPLPPVFEIHVSTRACEEETRVSKIKETRFFYKELLGQRQLLTEQSTRACDDEAITKNVIKNESAP